MLHVRRILKGAAALGAVVGGVYVLAYTAVDFQEERENKRRLLKVAHANVKDLNVRPTTPLPSRQYLLDSLAETAEFDVLVIGGGVTGAGVVLDAQSRGLMTAMVEMGDFSSGTTSRSTKLIHGGVRYLQAALSLKMDFEQYRIVKKALFERATLVQNAPHLSSTLPIMLPVYSYLDWVYYWCSIKAYDFVAGKRILKKSYAIGKEKALELFPMLKKDSLVGALIYYEGQHDDARMNLALTLQSIRLGAKCANYVAVTDLIRDKDETGKMVVRGAKVRDEMTGKQFTIKAKCVVNATGAFVDVIRQMDDPTTAKIVVPSQGVHIVLPGYYSPGNTGLLDPQTSDGRVIFFLPWERMTMAGTTDSACSVTASPRPGERDVEFILQEIRGYLSADINVRRGDVLSAWAGLRPLMKDPNKPDDTKSLARNHIIEVSKTNLITIAGGKLTTYRHMAEETVDKAVDVCKLKPIRGCVTPRLRLEGGHNWDPLLYIKLVQDYGLEMDVAVHLAHRYGDRAFTVASMAKLTGKRWPIVGTRLHEEFPYLEEEVLYAIREYALTAVDVIARRTRLAFLNTHATEEALPRIVEIMAAEFKWDKKEKQRQMDMAQKFIDDEMGKLAKQRAQEDAPLNLTKDEKARAIERFNSLDKDKKGNVTINDLRSHFKKRGEKIDERLLHELLNEVDLNKNGEIDLVEFLQLFSGLKGGTVSQSRFARYLDQSDREQIAVERSGGGL